RERTLRRLGWVDQALVAPRFFRQKLGDDLRYALGPEGRISPAIVLRTTAATGKGPNRRQARSVTVLGLDGSFFEPASVPSGFDGADKPIVLLSSALAERLGVAKGATVTLRLPVQSELPREAALGRKDVKTDEWELEVAAVLQDDEPGNWFNLRPELDA